MIVKLCFSLLLPAIIYAQTIKIYFYTTETSINNFKSLKISFDTYLRQFGTYDFQPFHNKQTFEEHLADENAVIILSSWHYKKIYQKHHLEALLIAQKNKGIKDTKVLIGKDGSPAGGIITSAYDKEYTDALIKEIFPTDPNTLSVLFVPKEIDALMSVGFGMSTMALVSNDSYEYLRKINPVMTTNMKIVNVSSQGYRMLLAAHKTDAVKERVISIFKNMHLSSDGRRQLSFLGIDKMTIISPVDLSLIRGIK